MFLVATTLYIAIPKFFDYEKKGEEIKNFLLLNYQLEISSYNSIKYKIFPVPNISLENVNLTLNKNFNNFKANRINIYLDLNSIYKNKVTSKKIFINENKMIMRLEDLEYLFDYFQNLKLKLTVKNLDLNLKKENDSLIKFKNINFSNYGFGKDKIQGMIFDKSFEIFHDKKKKNLEFKILDTGISANFKITDYDKNQSLAGTSKINILNNYLKLDYLINKNQIVINRSKFRNKDLSLSFQNLIKLKPYFEMDLNINVEKINYILFSQLDLEKLLYKKDIIKKLNSITKIEYEEKKLLQNNLIRKYNSKIYLENGRMNDQSKIGIPGSSVVCKNETTLLSEPPRFYFKCNLKITNLKEFNKYFSISKNINNKPINLYFEGSINIFRNKVNFEKISIEETNYIANNEDKIFFKKNFEDTLLKDGFFNIFKTQKIKNFINEII